MAKCLLKILVGLSIAICSLAHSQETQLSKLSKVSVLTVGTGSELSAKFGHSSFRIQDPAIGMDAVYNYGLFDFDDPNFYLKFTTGKLPYSVGRYPYDYFERGYVLEQRWIKEQVLSLDQGQRQAIFDFLEMNIRPENKWYSYDFLFENCATKIPEVLQISLEDSLDFSYPHLPNEATFRDLIHENLRLNSWSNFGIDLALGSVIDQSAKPREFMFLPHYVYQQLEHTKLNGSPLVRKKQLLLDVQHPENTGPWLLSPLFWLAFLCAISIVITLTDAKHDKRSPWLDVLLLGGTGLAGLLIAFLWWGTDHSATKENYNILWAFAPNLLFLVALLRHTGATWLRGYALFALLLIALAAVLWMLGVQVFSPLVIFIWVALAVRYLFLFRHYSKQPL